MADKHGSGMAFDPSDVAGVAELVKQGDLRCYRQERQKDGDIRYWNVDETQHALLQSFKEAGEGLYTAETGRQPSYSFIMINDIESSRSPEGSGGGWHLDSFKDQYKYFLYLTDVCDEGEGAFAYFPSTSRWWFRAYALLKRAILKSVRYSEREANIVAKLGGGYKPIYGEAGTNFFLKTSLLHRGLPITTGRRILATLYIYDSLTPAMKGKMGVA